LRKHSFISCKTKIKGMLYLFADNLKLLMAFDKKILFPWIKK
jgi:hypothetical protein